MRLGGFKWDFELLGLLQFHSIIGELTITLLSSNMTISSSIFT